MSARRGAGRVLAVGVDVAARRGCDVVALADDLVAQPLGRVHSAAELHALVREVGAGAVAIDAPSGWAVAGRRRCEAELASRGIHVFTTPDAATGTANPFYDWMRTGFAMFAGAAPLEPIETFPHAVAVALRGALPARGLLRRRADKRIWRGHALVRAGVDPSRLRGLDQVDAALCALVAYRSRTGAVLALGDPAEGTITVPLPFPPGRFPTEATGDVSPVRRPGTR